MDRDEQRLLGIKLAEASGKKLQKTETVIRDTNSCFEVILRTAVAECGLDTVLSQLLQGPPEWAYQALRHIQDVGKYREALIKKAAEEEEWALHAYRLIPEGDVNRRLLKDAAGSVAQTMGNISGMNLLNQGGYVCQWTLKWANNGKIQPKADYSDWGNWHWSGNLSLGQSSGRIDLSKFALPNAPLQAGNEVWMYMWVAAGTDIESPIHFTYDPNASATANFSCSGTTTSDSLGFNGFSAAEKAA